MTVHIGFLIFPDITQLDLTGAYEVFATAKGTKVDLIWKDTQPVQSGTGIALQATKTFADCPQLDVICVPGGGGTNALFEDAETLEFIRTQAKGARYITSVCTGALVLGAAGLLKGKRATTHWNYLDYLSRFGAIPVSERVVTDGNVVTAAGVSAGIDFAFSLLAETVGREEAELIQLWLEYAPQPPFHCGNVEEAGPDRVAKLSERFPNSRPIKDALLTRLGW